jgi:hypothetical protein
LGGRDARKAVAGGGATKLSEAIQLEDVEWEKIGSDLMMTAPVVQFKVFRNQRFHVK